MRTALNAEEHNVGSTPRDRDSGRQILERLRIASSQGDQLAKAILRAHALFLGILGLTALAKSKGDLKTQAWLELHSPQERHKTDGYVLPVPNLWIDLVPGWRRSLRSMLSSEKACREILERWKIVESRRVRDSWRWFARCLEATLLDDTPTSQLLIGIANFRRDAAVPAVVSLDTPFVNRGVRTGHVRAASNPLRSALRARRKGSDAEVVIPTFEDLAQLDDPIAKLASLLLANELSAPSETDRSGGRAERYSRAQEEALRSSQSGDLLEISPVLRIAWTTIGTQWPALRPHFSREELALLEPVVDRPLEEIFIKSRMTNAGAFNLIPPSQALQPYHRSFDPTGSLADLVHWAFYRLMCRCGCRASDLFCINSTRFSGVGTHHMCLTLPHTKTTGRRVLPIGVAMPPREIDQFQALLGRFEGNPADWFPLIMTGGAAERWLKGPERWENDFAYADFRRAIAPAGIDYLPTHTPRHAFATAVGLFAAAQLLGDFDRDFFRMWTQDPAVLAIAESHVPDFHRALDDSILLANQIMGHKTPAQFIGTYCHAWPLILGAAAERRLPNVIPWASLQAAQEAA